MSAVPKLVSDAVQTLLDRFEAGDYNPTPIIDIGAIVANADGVVDADEIDTLRRILEPMLGPELDADVVKLLIDAAVRILQQAGLAPRVRLVSEILLDCDAVEPAMTVALGIALASEGLSEPERAVLADLARACDLPSSRLEELTEQVKRAYAAA